jgi:hypothetical protein
MNDYCWLCGHPKDICQCKTCSHGLCHELVSEPVYVDGDPYCDAHAAQVIAEQAEDEAREIVSNMHSMEFIAGLCGMGAVR